MYAAWRYGEADPFALYHGLGADYRPLTDPSAPRRLPTFPGRVKLFIYGLGLYAHTEQTQQGGREGRRVRGSGR